MRSCVLKLLLRTSSSLSDGCSLSTGAGVCKHHGRQRPAGCRQQMQNTLSLNTPSSAVFPHPVRPGPWLHHHRNLMDLADARP